MTRLAVSLVLALGTTVVAFAGPTGAEEECDSVDVTVDDDAFGGTATASATGDANGTDRQLAS